MLNRRDFARIATLTTTAALSVGLKPAQSARNRRLLKPPRLREGDLVGLVLPASMAFESDSINLAREQLEAIGFRVKVGPHAFDRHGYLAGTDRDRAADINAMFADDEIRGVICYTGGWGSPRVLPYLDYDLIARKPKVLLGYSDITALLNGVHQKTGLVTFHGPVGASNIAPFTLDHLKRALMSAEPIGTLANPPKKDDELVNRRWRTLKLAGGTASGRIAGGNLTLVASLMGTPWEVDTDGAILFLEDIHEELYRVDRMLTQLHLSGKFERVAAVVFGRCSDCPVEGPSFSLEEILRERFASLGVPAISGFAFGHIEQYVTLPIGMRATLDADAATVTIDEAAVV